MLRICWLFLLLAGIVCPAHAGFHEVSGKITDSTGAGLDAASIALLRPEDSTLVTFAISSKGTFLVKDVPAGDYLLQAAMMGYFTEYRSLHIPLDAGEQLYLRLKNNDRLTQLDEVVISGEKIPIRVKGDTLEYNAGSYKVKPNAVVEDLLRKLPGVQVDKEGNIKSMGKSVSRVLVDGKEFFGDDPKVATKNLPADAVDKIQAFEKKSDQALFSGIDDGDREQTLNLLLKPDKKTGYFGEASGALGLPEQYDASLKAFKFKPKSQLAALGMLNNINKFGFTFQDYLDYNGGIGSMMGEGGAMNVNTDDMPVDFGQPVTGKVASGALGLNYSVTPRDGNRFNISYMGNGVQKFLDRQTQVRNFTPAGNFDKNDNGQSKLNTLTNRLSFNWRNQVDSANLLGIKGYVKHDNSKDRQNGYSESYIADLLQNRLDRNSTTRENGSGLGVSANLTRKLKGKWQLLQARLAADYTYNRVESEWQNNLRYTDSNAVIRDAQYQYNFGGRLNTEGAVSMVRRLGHGLYLEPRLAGAFNRDASNRQQGMYNETLTDSLSPSFYRDVYRVDPAITLKNNKKELRWNLELKGAGLWLSPYANNAAMTTRSYRYLMPAALLEWNIKNGERLSARYSTEVTAPAAAQLMPFVNYNNPLTRTRGNVDLAPEYAHNLNLSYTNFDQFSMTSFFAFFNARYTLNKIDWSRTVYPDLSQDAQMINTRYAALLTLSGQYARPVRRLGLNISVNLDESWNRAVSPVNGVENTNNTLKHQLELEFSNLNNDVWDLRWGGNISISNARYSLNKELNNNFYNYSGFARIAYQPNEHWYFSLSGDITHYTAKSFDAAVTIPILKAEVSRYILANQRGTVSLRGFDLLDRNKAVQRISQLNNLIEQRSNVIGRYFMLSFTYKLNRAGKAPGSIQVKTR
ncbi:TonB-dependent receptor [Taibaiella chishuiensis]|uniref:Outer membrane receptor protein involved in Fe transport n=1 Tax=Taibaiella chishuiensis TaxID=1434707 RepID=A0A2P8CXA0_9BACT|nr:TonB-dependent receptor [Taibaiella chishuiensis]PSK89602.1 outer membrane receptor protein involved in Fe transport [Taibaiella chishuiensis]